VAGGGVTANGSERGHVRVFQWQSSTWVQLGTDIRSGEENDGTGRSISLSNDGLTLAVQTGVNSQGELAGLCKVYTYDSSNWVQRGQDINSANSANENVFSVSLSGNGDTVVFGAATFAGAGEDDNQGIVRVFQFTGSSWIQSGGDIVGDNDDLLGSAVAISEDGTRVAVGASGHNQFTGVARVFQL